MSEEWWWWWWGELKKVAHTLIRPVSGSALSQLSQLIHLSNIFEVQVKKQQCVLYANEMKL